MVLEQLDTRLPCSARTRCRRRAGDDQTCVFHSAPEETEEDRWTGGQVDGEQLHTALPLLPVLPSSRHPVILSSRLNRVGRVRSVIPPRTWHAPRAARPSDEVHLRGLLTHPLTSISARMGIGRAPPGRVAQPQSERGIAARFVMARSAERAVSCGAPVSRCRQTSGEDDGLSRWAILPSRVLGYGLTAIGYRSRAETAEVHLHMQFSAAAGGALRIRSQ
jgi:hypothetical protein